MSVQVDWDNGEQTVLRYTVSGCWTWEDFYLARDQARDLADLAPVSRVNSIIDIGAGNLFPQNALTHFRRLQFEAHPKLKQGNVVIVQNDLFVRSLMDIMRRVNPQAMRNFHSARTLEDARDMLVSRQEHATLTA